MLTFFPAIQPYAQHEIKVDALHTLYVEESGTAKGIPILYVHGGPGGGCSADSRRFFDPNIYRIILFDQRGSGQSKPHSELHDNTTQHLLSDIEAIREKLDIKQWVVFGGSWGSTLSLVYAITHPSRVLGLILRGIFLNRQEDLDWLYNGKGANFIFPDYWDDFVNFIRPEKRHNLIQAYYELLTSDDEFTRLSAAKNWATWEARCSTLEPNPKLIDTFQSPHTALSISRIEAHYFINNCFLEENFILNNIKNIDHIPGIIVHGRYDIVCTLDNAWLLNQAWPNSQLNIIRDAGHSALEKANLNALIHATNEMPRRI